MKCSILLWGFVILFSIGLYAQPANQSVPVAKKQTADVKWVDSVYDHLSLEERVGQLFMIAAYSGGEKANQQKIEEHIKKYGIGGVIFMQGNATAQATQTNLFQSESKVPLFVAMDAEWGLGMRLTGIRDLPRQMMMGAMKDSTLVYKMASAIAAQCRRLGVQIDFGPVADINSNPENPVINFRSFGERKDKVAHYTIQYMRGLQDNGVMACAKHFPGHGDTDVDSHKDLPVIGKSKQELKKMELVPFQQLFDEGIQSVMTAHLNVKAFDTKDSVPSSLSSAVINDLLRKEMGFEGLVFTDALNMEGVAKFYTPGEIDLKAFKAGNDILLFSQDVPSGIQKIMYALSSQEISEERLAYSVKKILRAKYNAGLSRFTPIDATMIDEDLNQYIASIRKAIAEAAITWLNDPHRVIERIKNYSTTDLVYVGIGCHEPTIFSNQLKGMGIKEVKFLPEGREADLTKFIKSLSRRGAVIVGVHGMNQSSAKQFGLGSKEQKAIQALSSNGNAMTVFFGNPYVMKLFPEIEGAMVAYDEAEETQMVAAKMVMGLMKPKGTLPVTASAEFRAGEGILPLTNTLGEVADTILYAKQSNLSMSETNLPIASQAAVLQCCVSPEALGIDNNELDKLDSYLQGCIQNSILPGCRVLAAKDGKVFYDKSFGYLTYDQTNGVDMNTLYDLASVTKVAATTMAVMKLYEQGKLDLEATLGKYLPFTKGTDKESLVIKDVLAHQAGLKSWIPFYKETLDSLKNPLETVYSHSIRGHYNVRVAPGMYMRNDWKDTMWSRILASPLENVGHYVYSDLDFIFMQEVVEAITKKPLNDYVTENFYKPLGMTSTCFNPKQNLPKAEVAPSEEDNYFRYQTLQGYVHDMGAAMFGGVSGHAGLFSSANDVAILFQMLLNGGVYKGKRFFKKSTVDLFTSRVSSLSRRGLGFDKPEPSAGKNSPCADNCSLQTFGHQGFTGTCVWADPSCHLIFVFLSNATYPDAEHKKINHGGGVRENTQAAIYRAMGIANRYRK